MALMQTARGAGLDLTSFLPGQDTNPPGPANDRFGSLPGTRPGSTAHGPTASLDRLIARIESGTATPEDIDDLPDGVLQYLDAVTTLCDAGILDQDWEATPTDGILVRSTGRAGFKAYVEAP